MTHYNAIVDLDVDASSTDTDVLLSAFAGHRPVLATTASSRGSLEAVLTINAGGMAEAAATAVRLARQATGREPASMEIMTTAKFDTVYG